MGILRALPQTDYYQRFRPKTEQQALKDECLLEQPFSQSITPQAVWDRENLRQWMVTHLVKGSKMLKKRVPYIASTVPVSSPEDPEVTFDIKKIGLKELISYRDRDAVTRYLARDGENGDEFVTEKEYPRGSNQLDTIQICLGGWNLTDPQTGPGVLPITRENIIAYLTPDELDFLFDECFRINPILLDQAKRKKNPEGTTTTTGGSTQGGTESSSVHTAVPERSDPEPAGV